MKNNTAVSSQACAISIHVIGKVIASILSNAACNHEFRFCTAYNSKRVKYYSLNLNLSHVQVVITTRIKFVINKNSQIKL